MRQQNETIKVAAMPRLPRLRIKVEIAHGPGGSPHSPKGGVPVRPPRAKPSTNSPGPGEVSEAFAAACVGRQYIAPIVDVVLLVLALESGTEPPVGSLFHGFLQWSFTNRVELLHAIDDACGKEPAR